MSEVLDKLKILQLDVSTLRNVVTIRATFLFLTNEFQIKV